MNSNLVLHKKFVYVNIYQIRNSCLKYQNVIYDFPPGGLPEYLTEVKEPGPACGLAYGS